MTTRTRKSADTVTVVPVLNDGCCKQVTIATFRMTTLIGLTRRHTGPFCNGAKHPISITAWRQGRYEAA